MKITGFPLSIVFLSSSFPFHKRKNEAQRNKAWKQWEEDEKWKKIEKMNTMRNNEKLWKIEKTNENNENMMKNKEKNNKKWWKIGKKWTQWENDEKRRKSNEKLWKTRNKWKQLENDENAIFFFSTTCGRLPLHTKMAHDLGERWKLPCFLYL